MCCRFVANRKGVFVLFRILLLSSVAGMEGVRAESPDQIDQLAKQWLDTESQISALQIEWKTQQPVLQQRIQLLASEKKQLEQLLKESTANGGGVDAKRSELLAEQASLEQQQSSLTNGLSLLLERLKGVVSMLPPALSKVWQDEQNTLSGDAQVSQQLQVALAQLDRLAEFDRRVSIHEGIITSENGDDVLVCVTPPTVMAERNAAHCTDL